jgi:hypothetical protein
MGNQMLMALMIAGDYYYVKAGNDLLSLQLANCSLGVP